MFVSSLARTIEADQTAMMTMVCMEMEVSATFISMLHFFELFVISMMRQYMCVRVGVER